MGDFLHGGRVGHCHQVQENAEELHHLSGTKNRRIYTPELVARLQ